MIILPPEEKKPSPVAKWIFRILLTLCIFVGMGLFGLSILSGNSDTHRRGLEQAMSNIFHTNVRILKLQTFNFFPQFVIDAEDVEGISTSGAVTFHAQRILVAFSLFDILSKRGLIEDLQIKDLTLQEGVVGPQELVFSSMKIIPSTAGKPPYVDIKGTYGGTPLAATLELTLVPNRWRPAYRFLPGAPVNVTMGRFALTGLLGANKDDYQEVNGLSLRLDGEEILTGSILVKPVEGKFALHIKFNLGESSGLLVYVPSKSHQQLSFEKVNFDDFMKNDPVWMKLVKVWKEEVARGVSAHSETEPTPDRVSLKIKELQGAVSGQSISGEFVYTNDHITGWWQGQLNQISAKNAKIPTSSEVTCALLRMTPKGNAWATDYMITVLSPLTVKSRLEIDYQSGKIKYQTDRVSEGVSTFSQDLSAFGLYRTELELEKTKVCSEISDFARAPVKQDVKPDAPALTTQP